MDITTNKKQIKEIGPDGKPVYEIVKVVDPFRGKLLLETIKNLEERVKGAAVQRSEILHGQYQKVEDTNIVSIDDKIKELETKLQSITITHEIDSNITNPDQIVEAEFAKL
jgi:hypothetical protein